MSLVVAIIPGLGTPAAPTWNGYVEEDYVYAAAASAGTIQSIAVDEGQMVKSGDVLFLLDQSQQQAQYDAAKARADAAQATLQNLQTGSRQEEIDVTKAQLMKAQADLNLAEQNLARTQDLFDRGLTAVAALDQSKATVKPAQAAADQLQAQLKVQQLPARDAQVIAAEATFAAAKADADTAKAALESFGLEARLITTSAELGVAKPSPDFFRKALAMSDFDPAEVLYVGDRLDNDVIPARSFGMRTALLERGPWGRNHVRWPDAALADFILKDLAGLPTLLAEMKREAEHRS